MKYVPSIPIFPFYHKFFLHWDDHGFAPHFDEGWILFIDLYAVTVLFTWINSVELNSLVDAVYWYLVMIFAFIFIIDVGLKLSNIFIFFLSKYKIYHTILADRISFFQFQEN